ncbi:hypothetical protein K4F52_010046 [Lecanicillium sp. MT-2017a]|nr:hypothetical protein K4F52_010046 [Lecanicillium sp. MT-2017a]
MASFSLFSSLPAEIRLKIWLATIPDDQEEVCLCWPGDAPGQVVEDDPLSELPVLPLTVDTGFPAAMHVCRESRALIQDSRLSGVWFRASYLARCMAPFRRFNPDLDELYLSHDSIHHLDLFSAPPDTKLVRTEPGSAARRCYDEFMGTLCATKRLAVNIALVLSPERSHYVQTFFWEHALAPERLTVVIAGTTPCAGTGKYPPSGFVPPGRRCRLTAVTDAAGDAIVVGDSADGWPPTMSLEAAVLLVRESLEYWSGETPGEGALLDRVVINTKTFVEYQKDGTWQEVCMQRTYDPPLHPGSREYVPLNRRPNPELVRVHDADYEFEPAMFEWQLRSGVSRWQ